ncbi:hypothetical protein SAMN05216338_10173 [Bradyrhizobium sp. Rc2d]|nr:hypothetical protein SAMN05216338_10173 [Bradyrhizobium sp. Rc2d]
MRGVCREADRALCEGVAHLLVIARSSCDEAIQTVTAEICWIAEPVIGPRSARTRWLAMTSCKSSPHRGCHAPRKRGIQYAAASRLKHCRFWNTGLPAFAGNDTEFVETGWAKRSVPTAFATIGERWWAQRYALLPTLQELQVRGLDAHLLVIARSSCDEAIQTVTAEILWIASLRSQ